MRPTTTERQRLTTNSTWDVPARLCPVERVLCKDHMTETMEYDGGEQCVACGSARLPVKRDERAPV